MDFEAVKARLESKLARAKSDRDYAYYAVLYTQLLNGARVSEAVDALREYARTGEAKVRVKVRKRKNAERLIVVPNIDLKRVAWILDVDPEKLTNRVEKFAKSKLGANTHALRYAFITHLGSRGVSAQLIAKITGHARLDYILYYTQRAEAEKLLEDIARGER